MNKFLKIFFTIIIAVFGFIGLVCFFIILFNEVYFSYTRQFDPKLASEFGSFFGGFIGTIFGIVSVLLLIYNLYNQSFDSKKLQIETNFFRMIDYHNQNVNQLKIINLDIEKKDISEGRRAFVQFKIQIHRLLKIIEEINESNNFNLSKEEVLDVSYIIFYYGLEGSWKDFIGDKLKKYPGSTLLIEEIQKKINDNRNLKIGRTNQTNLSTYFRNMYNAIKMIDDSKFLSKSEKEDIIRIYRAQISNPELYVLFFNLMSRFGKKWIENNYIIKYNFLRNIPKDYCDGYEPKVYFPIKYEDDEY